MTLSPPPVLHWVAKGRNSLYVAPCREWALQKLFTHSVVETAEALWVALENLTAGGMVLLELQEARDWELVERVLLRVIDSIRSQTLRILILSSLENNDLRVRAQRLGIGAWLPAQSTLDTVKNRIENELKIQKNAQEGAVKPPFQWMEPLHLDADYWILPDPSLAHAVLGRWYITLAGPPTSHGIWKPHEKGWRWTPVANDAQYPHHPDAWWYFIGDEPTSHGLLWTFSGTRPRLEYRSEDGKCTQKFSLSPEGTFTLRRNSRTALRKLGFVKANLRPPPAPKGASKQNPSAIAEQDRYLAAQYLVAATFTQLTAHQGELFAPISQEATKAQYAQQAAEEKANGVVWTSLQKFKFDIQAAEYRESSGQWRVLLSTPQSLLMVDDLLKDSSTQSIYFKMNLAWAVIFAKAKKSEVKKEGSFLCIPMPPEIYRLQRRKFPRIALEPDSLFIQLGKIKSEVIDLSAGGMQIETPKFIPPIKVGTLLPAFRFIFKGNVFACAGAIRWHRTQQQPPADFYGLEFAGLSEVEQQLLVGLILEEGFSSM